MDPRRFFPYLSVSLFGWPLELEHQHQQQPITQPHAATRALAMAVKEKVLTRSWKMAEQQQQQNRDQIVDHCLFVSGWAERQMRRRCCQCCCCCSLDSGMHHPQTTLANDLVNRSCSAAAAASSVVVDAAAAIVVNSFCLLSLIVVPFLSSDKNHLNHQHCPNRPVHCLVIIANSFSFSSFP